MRYDYLKSECINESVIKADLETNGEWIYPAQTGSDLYVVQVYETDRFDEAAFFDYGKFIAHTQMQSGIPISNIDHQIHSAADCEIVLKIQPSVELNFVDVSAWEYPIQNGSDLTVTQVGFIKQHQYKLEVK